MIAIFKKLIISGCIILLGTSAFAKELSDGETIPPQQSAIINGEVGSKATYPWMVFLADEFEEQYCGASLISPTWILTAAHCFLNEDGNAVDLATAANSVVVLNSTSTFIFDDDAIIAQIGQIIIHPNYEPDFETSPNESDFDMALVEITAAVELQPVFLLSGNAPIVPAGTLTLIMGWGTTAIDEDGASIDPSDILLTANQQVVSVSECFDVYGGGITENMLCASGLSDTDTTDTCQGDSGGPLTVATSNGFVQIGVVSFGGTETGPICGDPDAPGVYANVSALANFIQDNTTEVVFTSLDGVPDTGTDNGAGAGAGEGEGDGESAALTSVISTSVSGNDVNISWTAVDGAIGYILYYQSIFPATSLAGSIDVGLLTSLDAVVPSGTAIYLAVQVVDETGPSDNFSNITVLRVD